MFFDCQAAILFQQTRIFFFLILKAYLLECHHIHDETIEGFIGTLSSNQIEDIFTETVEGAFYNIPVHDRYLGSSLRGSIKPRRVELHEMNGTQENSFLCLFLHINIGKILKI